MTGFVGEDGKQVILERSLIYAQMLANVVWNQYPVAGMVFLCPGTVVTQVVLV